MSKPSAQTLKNIGPVSAQMLEAVDIFTLEDLKAIGSVEAYCRVRLAGYRATLHLLYALEGALTDTRWDQIPTAVKQKLKAELAERTRFS